MGDDSPSGQPDEDASDEQALRDAGAHLEVDAGAGKEDGGRPRRDAAADAQRNPPAETDAGLPEHDTGTEDAEVEPGDASTGEPDDDAGVTEDAGSGMCSLDITLSAEVLFDVDWRGTTLAGIVPVLNAGNGAIRVVVRLDLRGGSNSVRSLVTACDAHMPDFEASWLIGEVYAGLFPKDSWDQPTMPRWDLGWRFDCRTPGCAFGSDQIVATIGARASAQDVWPGRTGEMSMIVPVDHDDDGLPGYTIHSANSSEHSADGKPYSEIPVSWTLGARAVDAAIALQLAGMFSGTFEDCDTLVGSVNSGRIEARAISCIAHDGPSGSEYTCSADQAAFLDENLPNWTVTGGRFRAKRIGGDADCAAVRAVWE